MGGGRGLGEVCSFDILISIVFLCYGCIMTCLYVFHLPVGTHPPEAGFEVISFDIIPLSSSLARLLSPIVI